MSKSIPTFVAERIASELAELEASRLERVVRTLPAKVERGINFSSNDYLGLASHPEVVEAGIAALRQYGASASSSRVVTGNVSPHIELEQSLGSFLGLPSGSRVLLFGSGALTNLGIFSALLSRHDLIVADRLAHATLLDGAKLSGARLVRFAHNDVSALEEILIKERAERPQSTIIIVTESVFSMDGDLAPLDEIFDLCTKYQALSMIDEAHALGVFGPHGAGLIAASGCVERATLIIGTLGKSLAAYGGFVAADQSIIRLLTSRARTFLYSTALPPAVAASAAAAVRFIREQEVLGERLLANARLFQQQLAEVLGNAPLTIGDSCSQIIPLIVGENELALRIADRLRQLGVIATAIRPPTVPAKTARLRLSISLAQESQQLVAGAELIGKVVREVFI